MNKSKVKVKVLNPRGKASKVNQIPVSVAPSTLSGKRIGILNNTKSGGEVLLPYIQEALEREVSGIEFHAWKVPAALSHDKKEPRLKEIARYSDFVVALMGD